MPAASTLEEMTKLGADVAAAYDVARNGYAHMQTSWLV